MHQNQLLYNLEAERAFLGTMIFNGFIEQILLAADDFYSAAHRVIYKTMLEISAAGEAVDPVTLTTALQRKGELEKALGAAYISALTDGVPVGTSAPLKEYSRIVREYAVRRRFIAAATTALQLGASADFEELKQTTETLRRLLDARPAEMEDGSLEALDREFADYCQHLDEFSIRVGIPELDERTDGFQLGEVVTLIARTAVGKSAIAQNVMMNVLELYPESGVVFFSLEMPRLQAFERQLQIYSNQTRGHVIHAYRTQNKAAVRADDFVGRFKDRFAIIDKTGLTLKQIEMRVRALMALKRIRPVRLVGIDYLGFLGGGAKNATLVERVSDLARGVKELAKNLQAVVFLVAQTSRRAGDGSEEVSILDARDSGAIDESADFLLGAWRPELQTGISPENYVDVRGDLWFRLLKARRGLQDKFRVHFEGETLRVSQTGSNP
jgi:replicative DNA helicase